MPTSLGAIPEPVRLGPLLADGDTMRVLSRWAEEMARDPVFRRAVEIARAREEERNPYVGYIVVTEADMDAAAPARRKGGDGDGE